MIESVRFHNFKALRDTTLPLGRFTLLVGPNGSGKSTVFQALEAFQSRSSCNFGQVVSAAARSDDAAYIEIEVRLGDPLPREKIGVRWRANGSLDGQHWAAQGDAEMLSEVTPIRVFSLDARAIAAAVQLNPSMDLTENGGQLAGVLDRLRDQAPERFEALRDELCRWIPEFDRILFETPRAGQRAFLLRTRDGQHKIWANQLSQGTLLSLAILTLAYLPERPPVVCLEEPDRGIHPRLLRQVRDALYRLCYPEDYGEERAPTQVVATTHSPIMLDLYRDRPEEIVIANKIGQEVKFERLSDQPNIHEILGEAHLGEIWYTGILGGVPCES